jgi:hypothetical protein
VVPKGHPRARGDPASPQAFVRLALYFDEIGTPGQGESIWRTRRGEDRPLTYCATATLATRRHSCPMLHINPKMLARLDELETDLLGRRARAEPRTGLARSKAST